MAVTVTSIQQIKVVETLPNNTGSAPDATRQVTHTGFDQSRTMNSGSSPPAQLCALFTAALVSGALTIDFRNLTGTNGGVVDGNGMKVQEIRVKNLGANPLTIVPGASNGLNLFGTSVTIPAGCTTHWAFNNNGTTIDSTHKTIDLSGTAAQTSQVTVILG